MKRMILLAVLLTFPLVEANATDDFFVKKFNHGGRYLTDAIQTMDGNYISVSTANTNWAKWKVRKITALGTKVWEKTLSSQFNVDWGGYWNLQSIAETNNGYILVGYAADDDVSYSVGIVVALDADGTVAWNKRFSVSGNIDFLSVHSTPDGGFIVVGGSYPYPWHPIVVKFTSDGNIQWYRTFEDLSYAFLSQWTSDNGVILAAEGSHSTEVVKVDLWGNILWKKNLAIDGFQLQALGSAPNDGVVIAGKSIGSNILSLIVLNSNGLIDWKAKFILNVPDFSISDLVPTADGGYAITGEATTGSGDGLLLKMNARKQLVVQRTIGSKNVGEKGNFVFVANQGGFIIFGTSGDDNMLFLSLNSYGIVPNCQYFRNLYWEAVFPSPVTVESQIVGSQPLEIDASSPFDVTSISSKYSASIVCE